ncbi:MAG TPA: hypothetical protein VND80_10870 [Steroidobacteraceae bacterium]|nr:hypothetical protein [Steroidobacteraceae bacterium]
MHVSHTNIRRADRAIVDPPACSLLARGVCGLATRARPAEE